MERFRPVLVLAVMAMAACPATAPPPGEGDDGAGGSPETAAGGAPAGGGRSGGTGGRGGAIKGDGGDVGSAGSAGAAIDAASEGGAVLDAAASPEDTAVMIEDAHAPALDDAGGGGGAFENSLGVRFLPVPGTSVRMAIWETRVKDYEAYAAATGAAVPHPDFPEMPLQPKAAVSRAQAQAFAAWLTQAEQKSGLLHAGQHYRLPSDAEWDAAALVSKSRYPWGASFPPPDHFANYGLTMDGFTYTAPVGSFAPNALGLYDLAGNLWEWIGEGCPKGGGFLVRGAGWNAHNMPYLESTFHYCFGADLVGHHNVGFRLVLEGM